MCHQSKGGTSCTPVGIQRWVSAAHLLDVLPSVSRIRQHRHHIHNGKPPFIVVPSATNRGFLKNGNVVFCAAGERLSFYHALILQENWLFVHIVKPQILNFFAQELRTPQPVSIKRIQKSFEQLAL
jgi:hypothetical protein